MPTEGRRSLARRTRVQMSRTSRRSPRIRPVFKVDLLYYLGIDRGFISGERPSIKADMAYLYYLPFSMVFTSGDRLHRRTAPLFLRPDQSAAIPRRTTQAVARSLPTSGNRADRQSCSRRNGATNRISSLRTGGSALPRGRSRGRPALQRT